MRVAQSLKCLNFALEEGLHCLVVFVSPQKLNRDDVAGFCVEGFADFGCAASSPIFFDKNESTVDQLGHFLAPPHLGCAVALCTSADGGNAQESYNYGNC